MPWSIHRVVLRLVSPMHIGWRQTGNLQQTRRYVPGRALWGALTAALTKDGNYKATGAAVKRDLRYTYLYPTTKIDRVTFWPWNPEFAWKYLGSYASTALSANVAKEGTLHETEYISPTTRDGEEVLLLGYIFEKDGCKLPWKEALTQIQLGGERGYGWGRVTPLKIEEDNRCFGCDIRVHGTPAIIVPKTRSVPAHCIADGKTIGRGEVEPLVGRETTSQAEFGGQVSQVTVCWVPGSTVNRETAFSISDMGTLHEINPSG